MIELQYLDIDPSIEKKLTYSAQNVQNTAAVTTLCTGGTAPLYATCEWFGWPLDGHRKLLKDGQMPLWSQSFSGGRSGCLGAGALGGFTLNSADATLDTPPVVEVQISQACTVPGITFVFSPEEDRWCEKMEITFYRGQTVVHSAIVYPDAPRWILPAPGYSFDRLTVRLLETDTPGAYAKLRGLYLGRALVFSHRETESVRLINEADPTLDTLTVDTMTVDVQDLQQWGLEPQKDQTMELYRDGQLLASHRIENCSRREKHRYTIRCRSLVGQLEGTFLGGMYENMPLETLLSKILKNVEFEVEAPLKQTKISGYLPVCTCRQALQQVAFAVGAVVSTRGTRGVRLCRVSDRVSGVFLAEDQFRDGGVETAAGVSRVEVVAHKYTPTREEVTLIDGEYYKGSDILLTFTEPYHSYQLSGGTILAQGVNYVRLSASGEITLKACTYRHTMVHHSRSYDPDYGDQVRKVEQATLIHDGNVHQVLDRLGQVYAFRQTLNQTMVVTDQYAGQQVALTDPFGGMMKGYITAMECELTPGGQTAWITLLGQRQTPEIAVGYAGMLYAGEKEEML